MNKFWYSAQLGYYEGDKQFLSDIPVPQRPHHYYIWNNGAWVIDPTQIETVFSDAIQDWLDAEAQAFNYKDIFTAATYATDPNALWAKQATAFISWRSAVWAQVYSDLAAVKAGTKQIPLPISTYIAGLPQPNIPTS